MKDKLKKFINGNILLSILFALLGILIAIFPGETIMIFAYTTATIMLAYGIFLLISGRKSMFNPFGFSVLGVALVVFGINAFVNSERIVAFLPLVLGIWFIGASISKLKMCASLKAVSTKSYIFALILAFLSMGIGIYFVIFPIDASETITMILGILLAVYAVADLVDMIIFKTHMEKVNEYFDDIKQVTGKTKVQEAKIVSEKKN